MALKGINNELCCYLVTQSCLTLCDPMDCSMPGFPVLHRLLEFAQTHGHWVSDAIQSSHPVALLSSCLQSFPASGFFPMSWLFPSDGESIGASATASVLPMNLQALQELNIQTNYAIFKKIAASSEHLTNNLLHDLFLWDLTQMFPIFVKVKLQHLV